MGLFFFVFGTQRSSKKLQKSLEPYCRLSSAVCSRKIYVKMAGFTTTVYNALCRRTSTFTLAILGGAFVFERSFDVVARNIFDNINKGKQWKDIKHKYEVEK